MKLLTVLLLLCMLPALLTAQELKTRELPKKEVPYRFGEPLPEEKEMGTIIVSRDEDTGLIQDRYDLSNDNSRFSLLYHVNADVKQAVDLASIEANYATKFEYAWLEFFLAQTTGKFRELTVNNPALGADSEELRESDSTILALGMGLSYRTHYFEDLLPFDGIFETTAANLGYYQMSEEFRGDDYAGPGIKADFGIHKRTSPNWHMGLKMSYNLATVKREAQSENETSSERSLTLSWLTFGFDLSYYF